MKGAGAHPLVLDTLNRYCVLRNFQWKDVTLHLHRVWPARRERWWAILAPADLPLPDLCDLDVSQPALTMRDLFRFFPAWSLQEELDLKLKPMERQVFADETFGDTNRHLNMNGICPTLLHSMGHQVLDCSCGCRGPLSYELLQSQGLHGVLMRSQWENVEDRRLHPLEAALLLGLPGSWEYARPTRTDLPLLGQIASPIQAFWIAQHLLRAFQMLSTSKDQAPRSFLDHILCTHHQRWPERGMFRTREISILYEDEPDATFVARSPVQVQDLLLAETRFIGVSSFQLFDGDVLMHPQELIRGTRLHARVGNGPVLEAGCSTLWVNKGLDDPTMTSQGQSIFARHARPADVFWGPRHVGCLLDSYVAGALCEIRARSADPAAQHYGILWTNYHWQLFCFHRSGDCLQATCYDGCDEPNTFDLELLCNRFMLAWGCTSYELAVVTRIRQTYGTHCGAIALGRLLLVL